ncbi:MAG: hypothetical protein ACI4S9_01535, partial [Christensenellales bacterium]
MRRFSVITMLTCFIMVICISLCACGTEDGPADIPADKEQDFSATDSSGIAVSGKFESGSVLVVEQITGEEKTTAIQSIEDEKYYKDAEVLVFDISVMKDNVKIQPSGKAQVTIPVTGLDSKKQYVVFHVRDNGTVDTITPQVRNGNLVFETDGFSYFIVAEADTREIVNVSVNILPLAAYGTLRVNGELLTGAASYKTKHYEGDVITVEAIAASGHHFKGWVDADDEVLSTESLYEFTVGKNEIVFSAFFTSGHVVTYTDITEDNHTESCRYCDYSSTVSHTFVD